MVCTSCVRFDCSLIINRFLLCVAVTCSAVDPYIYSDPDPHLDSVGQFISGLSGSEKSYIDIFIVSEKNMLLKGTVHSKKLNIVNIEHCSGVSLNFL